MHVGDTHQALQRAPGGTAMLDFNKWVNAHSEDIVAVDADQMRRIGKLVRGVKL